MRPRFSGSASTLFMFVPLIIVPLLAMFGFNEPKTLSASAESDVRLGESLDVGESAFHEATDLVDSSVPSDGFTDLNSTHAATGSRREMAPPDWSNDPFSAPAADKASWQPPPNALSGWTLNGDPPAPEPNRLVAMADSPEFAAQQPASQPDRAAQPDLGRPQPTASPTWRAAMSRLHELGIRNYWLQPGTQPDAFHFSCSLTPADNPRVTHRFEAQASDPLEAIREVISQVEQWNLSR